MEQNVTFLDLYPNEVMNYLSVNYFRRRWCEINWEDRRSWRRGLAAHVSSVQKLEPADVPVIFIVSKGKEWWKIS